MYLKNDKIVAEVGDMNGEGTSARIVMRSHKTGLGNEYILDPTAVVGWSDGAVVRRADTPRLGKSGDFREPASFGARIVTLSGTAVADTHHDLLRMRDDMMSLFTVTDYDSLSIDINGSKRWLKVGLEGTPSWVQQTDNVASFRISFYAPDPHLYGYVSIIQTNITRANKGGLAFPLKYPLKLSAVDVAPPIINNGNAPAWPIFKVIGDFKLGFTIQDNLGNGVRYNGMVTKVSPVIIDMGKGTATQNGIDRTTNLDYRNWFSIPPKSSIRPSLIPTPDLSGDAGTGWCDIIVSDTWI